MDFKNYYDLLEVVPTASQEDIHSAYVRAKNTFNNESLALYSLMSDDDCSETLNLIEEAYSILSVAQKRQDYDIARGFIKKPKLYPKEEKAENSLESNLQTYSKKYQDTEVHIQENSKRRDHKDFSIKSNEVEVSKLSVQNRFALNYEIDSEMEKKIESAEKYTGQLLKEIREYKQMTIERLADLTKISKNYLKHIENEETDKLPALVYVRGFVYQFAKSLKLNSDLVAKSYMEHLKSKKEADL